MKDTLVVHGQEPTGPIEGEWFKVNPYTINRELFEEEREDAEQEKVRRAILRAIDYFPRKESNEGYTFETLITEHGYAFFEATACYMYYYAHSGAKIWERHDEEKNVNYQYDIATEDEQALEWASRIQSGESWEKLCNEADTAERRRMIERKVRNKQSEELEFIIVGGSRLRKHPATFVDDKPPMRTNLIFSVFKQEFIEPFYDLVPLIVRRRKI